MNVDKRIQFRQFKNLDWRRHLNRTYKTSSIARRLSDLFWYSLPWDKIKQELGGIHIFDTGCGSGNYGVRISDVAGSLGSYTGVDAKEKPNWEELKKRPNFKLIKSSSNDISQLIPPNTNLFITQSAIEHFDEDLLFFKQINEFIKKNNRSIMQIHLFPAAATLPLYLFHGLRQYTPRTISKITQIFDDGSKFYLCGLGGNKGKHLHWKYFTKPLLILRRGAKWSEDPKKYDAEILNAIESDINKPSKSPLFWALIIHSNLKEKLW